MGVRDGPDASRMPPERMRAHRGDCVVGARLGNEHDQLALVRDEQRIEPDAIVCSPLPRAVQTAELLAASLDFLHPIVSLRALEPSAQPRVAATNIQALGVNVIVVGHEPSISSLGAYLLGRPSFPPFRTAQCCAIEEGKPTFTARADVNQVQAYFVE